MKRGRSEVDSISMANCLMLLSRGGDQFEATYSSSSSPNNRVFQCKTCNRQFSSFQALGGHRASHKKPRLMGGDGDGDVDAQFLHGSPQKPKTHECSICGLEFAIGQALGGHMRRHRAATLNGNLQSSTTLSSSSGGGGSSLDSSADHRKKLADDSKRVLVLDLNLTPLENDLEILKIAKATPLVDYFH